MEDASAPVLAIATEAQQTAVAAGDSLPVIEKVGSRQHESTQGSLEAGCSGSAGVMSKGGAVSKTTFAAAASAVMATAGLTSQLHHALDALLEDTERQSPAVASDDVGSSEVVLAALFAKKGRIEAKIDSLDAQVRHYDATSSGSL